MFYATLFKYFAQKLGFFNGDSTDKHRLPFFVALNDLVDNRVEFALLGFIDNVVVIHPYHGLVCGNFYDVNLIDLVKLFLFGKSRTGHTGKLFIHAEVVLEGYRRKRF